jgi:HAD superfamily hydrolase (TIGR01493 family)
VIDTTKVEAGFFDCFGAVFRMVGISNTEIAAYVSHVNRAIFTPFPFPHSWWDLKAHHDSADGLRAIQKLGIKCFAMSNGPVDLIKHISDANGIEWDGIIDFPKAKVYKPYPEAYRVAQSQTGILPAASLMITANPTFGDVEGSQSIGMQCQVIRQGGKYPNTIIDLADLLSE